MTSNSDKRQTRIGLDSLKYLQPLPPIPKPKELFTQVQSTLRDDSRSPDHLPQGLKRRRSGSPEGATIKTRDYSQELVLPKAVDTGVRPGKYVRTKNESPWQSFQKVYELKLDGFIVVAIRKSPSCELVTVKSFVGSDSDKKVKRLQQTQHQNFVSFLEAFHSEGSVYVVLDYVPISLAHLVTSPAYPTESQLAAILGQVRYIISFLMEEQLLMDVDSRRSRLPRLSKSGARFLDLFQRSRDERRSY